MRRLRRAVVRLIEQQLRPRDICTRKAFENAAVGGGRDRRLDQRGPASAGDGE